MSFLSFYAVHDHTDLTSTMVCVYDVPALGKLNQKKDAEVEAEVTPASITSVECEQLEYICCCFPWNVIVMSIYLVVSVLLSYAVSNIMEPVSAQFFREHIANKQFEEDKAYKTDYQEHAKTSL